MKGIQLFFSLAFTTVGLAMACTALGDPFWTEGVTSSPLPKIAMIALAILGAAFLMTSFRQHTYKTVIVIAGIAQIAFVIVLALAMYTSPWPVTIASVLGGMLFYNGILPLMDIMFTPRVPAATIPE